VLIVDDEPDVVANWSRLLGRADYPCITASDGERALALLDKERPESPRSTPCGLGRSTIC
jgi:CheY-like chemotaxis protein